MCLIVLAIGQHPEFPVVLASNRDEFYERPSDPMHWWPDQPVLAGRDRRSGGTWLAIQRDASLALVTNYRSGTAEAGKRSRGQIPLQLLQQGVSCDGVTDIFADRFFYSGYNLLASNGADWFYSGSEDRVPCRGLYRGFYGLSNQLLQSDWPKVHRSRQLLQQSLKKADAGADAVHGALIDALHDCTAAPDRLLPETGISLALERILSPIFIRGDDYGTRATTVITVNRHKKVQVSEQQYHPGGVAGELQRFCWQV